MSSQDYCTYLINKIKECDEELLKIAKSTMPISQAYYETYLKMSRKNYVQLLSNNCNPHTISTKYFRKLQFHTVDNGFQSPYPGRVASNQNNNRKKVKQLQPMSAQNMSYTLRPVAKPFYPNNISPAIGSVDTEQETSKSLPPPLEDCDDSPIACSSPTNQTIDFVLFNNSRCCHGIYCPGYAGYYECPFEKI